MLKKSVLCFSIFALLILASGVQTAAADESAVAAATKAADSWLRLIDDGKYSESWAQTSTFFRDRVPQDAWAMQASAARDPLGAVVSRKLASANYTTSLPGGVPDGQYVVIQYKSSFAHKKSAIETVTPMREADGAWRVGGYYIR